MQQRSTVSELGGSVVAVAFTATFSQQRFAAELGLTPSPPWLPSMRCEDGDKSTQLELSVDRDSARLAGLFSEPDPAVKTAIRTLIDASHTADVKIGICGQGRSDQPKLAAILVEAGIDSMSLSPEVFVATRQRVAASDADVPD